MLTYICLIIVAWVVAMPIAASIAITVMSSLGILISIIRLAVAVGKQVADSHL